MRGAVLHVERIVHAKNPWQRMLVFTNIWVSPLLPGHISGLCLQSWCRAEPHDRVLANGIGWKWFTIFRCSHDNLSHVPPSSPGGTSECSPRELWGEASVSSLASTSPAPPPPLTCIGRRWERTRNKPIVSSDSASGGYLLQQLLIVILSHNILRQERTFLLIPLTGQTCHELQSWLRCNSQ